MTIDTAKEREKLVGLERRALFDCWGCEQADAEIERLTTAYSSLNGSVCQILGEALGYPWFKDDLKNFPDATEEDGVCVGDHVAESIASEAASRIKEQAAEIERLRGTAQDLVEIVEGITGTMQHGTWRNDRHQRLKDTSEWMTFYNATRAALSEREP